MLKYRPRSTTRGSGNHLFANMFFCVPQCPYFWLSGKQGAVQSSVRLFLRPLLQT